MDLEYKPPSLESFYSPSRQSVSPIWNEKDKMEDENDATVMSDCEDHSSMQELDEVTTNETEGSNGDINDALEWNNGVGTLAGSDLKFRINECGDIEVITEAISEECLCENTKEMNSDDIDEKDELKEKSSPGGKNGHPTAQTGIISDSNAVNDQPSNNNVLDNQSIIPPSSNVDEELENIESNNGKNEDLVSEIARCNSKDSEDTKRDTSTPGSSIIGDNMPDFDPVLNEDMANMLYGGESGDKIIPIKTEPDEMSSQFKESTEKSPCEICGKPSRLGNRFCSRQCLGRHAAFKRRSNPNGAAKKPKYGKKKKNLGKGVYDEHFSPHPDDIFTVVQDDSSIGGNDLKIKIRVASSSNEVAEPSQSPAPVKDRKRTIPNAYQKLGGQNSFSWSCYLADQNAIATSESMFEEVSGHNVYPGSNPFRIGMALEGVDPENEALICAVFVAGVQGTRVRLSFYDYCPSYDFWRNSDCPLLFPCGFCKKTGRMLQPPRDHDPLTFDWESFLRESDTFPAPEEIFSPILGKAQSHGFKVGQKLEAVDKYNPSLVCVASISDIIGDQLLISFDGWSKRFDYWCDASSNLLHKVNWCKGHNLRLMVPKGFEESKEFDWPKFLEMTRSVAADPTSFTTRTSHRFEVGMKLEAVDPRNHVLVRTATIADINGFQVKIHFDGWSEIFDFWTQLEDPNLHPVGWCEKTGHSLEPPLSESWESCGCPIRGCYGMGHTKGAKFHNHYSVFGCPYSPQNYNKEPPKNRLATVRYKRGIEDQLQTSVNHTTVGAKTKGYIKRKRTSTVERYTPVESKRGRSSYASRRENATANDAEMCNSDIVSKWSVDEVAQFIDEVTNDPTYGNIFRREEIDGKALLMITQAEILTILRIKLGPTVKIWNAVLNIKTDT